MYLDNSSMFIIVLSTVSYETFTYPEDPIAQRITECKKFHFAKQRKYCLEKILDE